MPCLLLSLLLPLMVSVITSLSHPASCCLSVVLHLVVTVILSPVVSVIMSPKVFVIMPAVVSYHPASCGLCHPVSFGLLSCCLLRCLSSGLLSICHEAFCGLCHHDSCGLCHVASFGLCRQACCLSVMRPSVVFVIMTPVVLLRPCRLLSSFPVFHQYCARGLGLSTSWSPVALAILPPVISLPSSLSVPPVVCPCHAASCGFCARLLWFLPSCLP